MSSSRSVLLAFVLIMLSTFSAGALAQTPCTLTCPANITVATPPGAGGVVINYPIPVASGSNCGGNIVQTAGLPPGQVFPIGTTTNVWRVDVVGGVFTTCQFTVTVTGTPALPTTPVPAVGVGGIAALILLLLGLGLFARRSRG
jgi:uncharacterized membrane protein